MILKNCPANNVLTESNDWVLNLIPLGYSVIQNSDMSWNNNL